MLTRVVDSINAEKTALRRFADALWNNPETAYKEKFASAEAARFLEERGFSVTRGCYDIETAFRCEFDNGPGPVFAICSEFDALPEIGHGCGHNLICTAGIAAFTAAAAVMKEKNLAGKLILLGTPAEEGGGGKVFMSERGCLDGVDAVMMVHPSGETTPDMGSTANIGLEVIFHGKSSHAAAHPEKGINALDAVNLLFTGVNTYRQYIPEHARMHGVILEGGFVPNVIPDRARCRFYLRSGDEEWVPRLEKRFRDIVKGAELMTGTTAEIAPFRPAYRSRKPNRTMNHAYIEYMSAQGTPVNIPEKPGRGSSDFGNFSQMIPGIHAYFAISDNSKPAAHTVEFAEAAGKDAGFESAMRAAAAQGSIACRFLADEEFRESVEADFANGCKPY